MERVSIVYKFLQCPSTDVLSELENLDFSLNSIKSIEDISHKQELFCKEFDIPYMQLMPHITKYEDISKYTSNHKIWNVKERYLYFDYGVIFWEINFNTEFDPKIRHHLNNYLQIEGHSLLSNAIYKKTKLCTGNPEPTKRCPTCDMTNTYDDIRLIITENPNIMNLVNYNQRIKGEQESIKIKNQTWKIRGLWQFVMVDSFKQNSLSKIRDSIIISSTLAITIKYSGNEILEKLAHTLPPYTHIGDDIEEKIENYIRHFMHRYFFTSPKFLLDVQSSRLHLPPTILKTLNYVYDSLVSDEIWNIDTDILQIIPKSLLVINKLFIIYHKIPNTFSTEFTELLNPFKSGTPIVDQSTYNMLTNEHMKLIFTMAKSLVQSNKIDKLEPIEQQSKVDPFTTSQLTEALGYQRGRKNEHVQGLVNDLVREKILIQSTPSELGVNKGPAKHVYYLNPQLAYVQLYVKIVQHSDDDEIDELVSYLENY